MQRFLDFYEYCGSIVTWGNVVNRLFLGAGWGVCRPASHVSFPVFKSYEDFLGGLTKWVSIGAMLESFDLVKWGKHENQIQA